jgi:hypothetical protein
MAFMLSSAIGVWTFSNHPLLTIFNILIGTCGVCLSSFTIGSSLIGIGLTPGQAMAAVVCFLSRL